MQIPKNVVQAGDVDPCHKIYIEDYVYTYLSQNRSGDKSGKINTIYDLEDVLTNE